MKKRYHSKKKCEQDLSKFLGGLPELSMKKVVDEKKYHEAEKKPNPEQESRSGAKRFGKLLTRA